MKTDIIICTFNEEKVIEKKLKNCFELDGDYNVIVVDDHSTDRTVELVRKYKGVTLLTNKHKKGKSGALRTGFDNTNSELIAITDADVLLKSDALRIAVANVRKKDVGAVCGVQKLLMTENKFSFVEDIYRKIYTNLRLMESGIDSAPIMHGQFMVIKRSNLVYPNEDLQGDDTDMAIKIRKRGYKTRYLKECIFYEGAPKDKKELSEQKIRRGYALIQVFWSHKKVFLNPKYGLYGLLVFPFEFSLYILQPLLSFLFFISIFFVLLLMNLWYGLIYLVLVIVMLQIPVAKTYVVMNKALLKGLYDFIIAEPISSWDKSRD